MVLVNLSLLLISLALIWRCMHRAGQTGSVVPVWWAMGLLLVACYYLVQLIVSLTG